LYFLGQYIRDTGYDDLVKIAKLKFEDLFTRGGPKSLFETNREFDINLSLVTYMRLHEALELYKNKKAGNDNPGPAVVCSASHLTLHGVSGYISDLAFEFSRIESKFRGGVICYPGVPILGGGQRTPSSSDPCLSLKGG
jgi:hypothetical protein